MNSKLSLVDICPRLSPEIVQQFQVVASAPLIFDWREKAVKSLNEKFPTFWIYRGGSHIAIHASAPIPVHPKIAAEGLASIGEAGRCLARIIESK